MVILAFAMLSGCATFGTKEAPKAVNAQHHYDKARQAMEGKHYDDAIKHYETLEARFPFDPLATKAHLEIIFSYYKANQLTAAIAASERFIRLHPRHPEVDYAYYMKGLARFEQDFGIVQRFAPVELAKRDMGSARQSFNDFSELAKRFPNSKYTPEARQRMLYIRNRLAKQEIEIANFYLEREENVAAKNRAQYVLDHYQGTPSVPEAFLIQIKAYNKLGLDDLAKASYEIMRDNYPEHEATSEAKGFM